MFKLLRFFSVHRSSPATLPRPPPRHTHTHIQPTRPDPVFAATNVGLGSVHMQPHIATMLCDEVKRQLSESPTDLCVDGIVVHATTSPRERMTAAMQCLQIAIGLPSSSHVVVYAPGTEATSFPVLASMANTVVRAQT